MGQRNIKTMYYIVLEHRHPMKSIPLLFFSYLKDHNHSAVLFLTSCENLWFFLCENLGSFCSLSYKFKLINFKLPSGVTRITSCYTYIMENNTSHDYNLDVFSPTLSFLVNNSPSTFEHAIRMLRDNSCSS